MPIKYILLPLLGLFILWAGCAAFDLFGQRKVFYHEGRDKFSDYWMPRVAAERGYRQDDGVEASGWIDGEFKVASMDRCYSAVSLLPLKAFPMSWKGAWVWAVLSCGLFVLALGWMVKWRLIEWVGLSMSMPVLFNAERANFIWVTATCVIVFLAWYEDDEKWKRIVAAFALAVAASTKISPALLGILYLNTKRGIDWRGIALSVMLSAALFVIPFAAMSDGFAGLPVMLQNAALNGGFGLRTADIGLIELWRTGRLICGLDVNNPWPGMMIVARLSQLFGAVALIFGARRRDYLLLVGGMLLAAGNMYYYAMLYLLPVFVLEYLSPRLHSELESRSTTSNYTPCLRPSVISVFTGRRLEPLLWLALLSPLQLVLLGHSCNQFIGNASLLALLTLRTFFPASSPHPTPNS